MGMRRLLAMERRGNAIEVCPGSVKDVGTTGRGEGVKSPQSLTVDREA